MQFFVNTEHFLGIFLVVWLKHLLWWRKPVLKQKFSSILHYSPLLIYVFSYVNWNIYHKWTHIYTDSSNHEMILARSSLKTRRYRTGDSCNYETPKHCASMNSAQGVKPRTIDLARECLITKPLSQNPTVYVFSQCCTIIF